MHCMRARARLRVRVRLSLRDNGGTFSSPFFHFFFPFCALTSHRMSVLPGITRMLEADHLKDLSLEENKEDVISPPLLKGPALEPFLAALGASHLTSLTLGGSVVWENFYGGQAVIGVLTGHPTLKHLAFRDSAMLPGMQNTLERGMIVALLANLVRAQSALVSLSMDTLMETLRNVRLLFDALAASRLRSLSFGLSCPHRSGFIDAECISRMILPACTACASLRELEVEVATPSFPSAALDHANELKARLAENEVILKARRAADCWL